MMPMSPVWTTLEGEIIARRLDGAINTTEPLVALVTRITYDVRNLNPAVAIAESSLRNLTPYGRVTADMDIQAAKVGQPCTMKFKANGPIWLSVAESIVSDPCS